MLQGVPKEIENLVRENLNVSEELDWDRRKRYYKLDSRLEPSLADMVKYDYFNYLRDTKEEFYPELIYLANNKKMLELILSKVEIDDGNIYEAMGYYIVNDDLELFKFFYPSKVEGRSFLYDAIKYNSINILKYIMFRFTYIRLAKALHENIRFLTPKNISILETEIRSESNNDYLRLLPLSNLGDDSDLGYIYDMIDNKVDPSKIIEEIKSSTNAYQAKTRLFSILYYLIMIKNKYFFDLFDFLAKNQMESLLGMIKDLYRTAADTNDYILIKRILITDYEDEDDDYIVKFVTRSK